MPTEATVIEHKFTPAEAVAFVRRQPARTQFRFHVWSNAPIDDGTNTQFTDGVTGSLAASRAATMEYLRDCISEARLARGARVAVTERNYDGMLTIWIGG